MALGEHVRYDPVVALEGNGGGDLMSPQTLTVSVPANLYSRLKQSADGARRSVEEEVLELLTSALADHTVPRDLAETVASLSSLDDAQLWQVARGQFTGTCRNSHHYPGTPSH